MELLGEVNIQAPQERVWAALNDAEVLKACIPGCESLTDESPDTRRATVMIKIGPVRARFAGKVTLSEMTPPSSCLMKFEGSGGAAGMASGSAKVTLTPQGADGQATLLAYAVNASVGGKLGQIGGRMIDASARQLSDQFFAALRGQLEPEVAPALESAGGEMLAPTAPTAPTASAAGHVTPVPPATAPATSTHPPPGRSPQAPSPNAQPQGAVSQAYWLALGVVLGSLATGFGVWLAAQLLHKV
ncbi:MAG: carbon monoxide dehydrogenase subunit G [Burkholderiaceae bacterium]|nr:carbon monoxide dehydrogenase subunit G [Burkholderiaceae bacterium]